MFTKYGATNVKDKESSKIIEAKEAKKDCVTKEVIKEAQESKKEKEDEKL